MKPKFAYLYISFIISLAILVLLSSLFYKRLNSHLTYSRQADKSYHIVVQLREVEEQLTELENYSRGYMLIQDSSFIPKFANSRKRLDASMDSLKILLSGNSDQVSRFLMMKATVINQANTHGRNINIAKGGDKRTLRAGILKGNELMDSFRLEAAEIEKYELQQRNELRETKQFFEDIFPGYFNTILIFAGVITLVSFYFINREVRIRARYQLELEKKLQELNISNSELKQFAYIASHDLQEPLRKIRMFSDKLVYKYRDQLHTESGVVIDRIEASAKRMQELIQDMLNFTQLINREDVMSNIDLNHVITHVLSEFIELTRARQAVITCDKLPVIRGNRSQMILLFKSLLDNAFKFAKPGAAPVIRITYQLVDASNEEDEHLKGRVFHKIVMEDKGIGFNNEFAEKIFMIFQRLHTQQSGYRGKGIGLAISQRIMTNHDGIIMARGMINDGATFIMYFPFE